MKLFTTGSLLLLSPLTLHAEGLPWLAVSGDTSLQFSVVYQEADDFWQGDNKVDLPDDLTQTTYWLSLNRGITDDLALDLRTGYAKSDFEPEGRQEGITDSVIGVTWRFHDEFLSDAGLPSAAIRVAGIIEGNYDTGFLSAIGDGASGAEASILVGKVFSEKFALAGDLGYRFRSEDVPDETFFNLSTFYNVTTNLTASLGYLRVESRGDLNIGDPDFTPERFPETEEDSQSFDVGVSYRISPALNFGLSYGTVINGRNTADSDVLSFSVGSLF